MRALKSLAFIGSTRASSVVRSAKRAFAAVSLFAAATTVVCSNPATLAGEHGVSAIVYGTATVAGGTPAAGASVVGALYLVSCSSAGPFLSVTSVTGSDGRYRFVVIGGNIGGEHCIRVSATANGASVTRDAPISLRPEGTDSVRVDLELGQ
jgi:hypothetical protein